MARLGLPRFGIDYYNPSSYFRLCPDWTWLATRCFNPAQPPPISAGEPGSYVLGSDLSFVRTAGLGRFIRLWVSGDQLMRLSPGYRLLGLDPSGVRSLDGALHIAASNRLVVDLVLFSYSQGSGAVNQFRPQALDGRHESLRRAYVQATGLLLKRLAGDRIDRRTVRVVDLQNEPYFQLERYFSTPDRLGGFPQCALSGTVDTTCVDSRIIHPWLRDLYRAARAATEAFLYTESDTGRLVTTNLASQRFWTGMYPADVYDIHAYDSTPWRSEDRWASARRLSRPWFTGEAGCASQAVACTYNGTAAAPVDRWWLTNLPRFGAQSVLVENASTLWTYRPARPSQTLTSTGTVLRCLASPSSAPCASARR